MARQTSTASLRTLEGIAVRAARDTDVKSVVELLLSEHHLEVAFDPAQFVVAESQGNILACARLKPLDDVTWEIASVVVRQGARRGGVGAAVAKAALARATGTVYALALAPEFFASLGFRKLEAVPAILHGTATSVCASSGFVPMMRPPPG